MQRISWLSIVLSFLLISIANADYSMLVDLPKYHYNPPHGAQLVYDQQLFGWESSYYVVTWEGLVNARVNDKVITISDNKEKNLNQEDREKWNADEADEFKNIIDKTRVYMVCGNLNDKTRVDLNSGKEVNWISLFTTSGQSLKCPVGSGVDFGFVRLEEVPKHFRAYFNVSIVSEKKVEKKVVVMGYELQFNPYQKLSTFTSN